MNLILIMTIVAVFIGVATTVGAVGLMLRNSGGTVAEERLDQFVQLGGKRKKGLLDEGRLLAQAIAEGRDTISLKILSRFGDFPKYLTQADTGLTPSKFLLLTAFLGVTGFMLPLILRIYPGFGFAFAAVFGVIPLLFVSMSRKRRLNRFSKQLPDALELVSRALRAGHSLATAFNLVATESPDPIRKEFARCYEEQNLGKPLEQALESMTDRVPNVDLRFFSTAVTLQRQTGGDLAEILDKIGYLIRERFKIFGQVQALTGEGRLSGIVLLALPPVLFVVTYRLNPQYCMLLFTDPLGQKMLTGAVILQVVGALVIRKIVNIKV